MYVWPCAPVLAQYLYYHRHFIKGKTILELGTGTALPSVVAAKCGAHIILSDVAHLINATTSCTLNGITDFQVANITWGQFSPAVLQLPKLDIVMASDCFYSLKDFEDILVTVNFLLQDKSAAVFWCTYQERDSDWSIEHLLNKWHLQCTHIPLSSFQADSPSVASSGLPGNHTIWMLQITTKK
uniref:Methyltransferase-like protein 23-like n=1 Tax=Saccoglossus kowalevskii TaxID=10224 RepID=A0ABM0MPP0_SACKO|nr:PREDICTED: methyltransferase-like protein 23-like [Saccoglossus kowalevskii]